MRMAELSTIDQLVEENLSLREGLALYQRVWDGLMDLLGEVMELALLLLGSLEERDRIMASAEGDWLASWGIGRGSEVTVWI